MSWSLLTLASLVGVATFAAGDVPTISHLFPAGMQRGAEVTVTCHGDFSWPLKVWAPGARVRVMDDKGKFTVIVAKDLAADRIWLRFYNADGAAPPIPFLLGSLRETQEVEPNNSPRTAQDMADFAPPPNDTDVTINGILQEKGDVDSFAVRLAKGQTLVAAVAANTSFGSPIDAILQVATPDGTVLAENHDDVGLDPRLAFTCSESGTYVVRLFAFPSTPGQRIYFHGEESYVYRLTLTTGPYITHAVPMSVSLCQADLSESSTVEVFGWNIPSGTRLPVVPLGETLVRSGPWSSFAPRTKRFGRAANDYCGVDAFGTDSRQAEIEANGSAQCPRSRIGLARAPGWAGSTRVRMVPHRVTPGVAQTTEDRPLTLLAPNAISGCIQSPRQTDRFHLPMKKDEQLTIAVESVSLDSLLVPLVQLRDPEGKIVAEVHESGTANDVSISYKATQDADYLLTVRDRYRHGGERYFYRLTVKPPEVDFELAVDTDSILLTLGKPIDIPVTITRRAGVGEPINDIKIEAVDLPDGVFSSAVVSEVNGETSSKVTLQLETEGVPFSGPMRIRGTSVESKFERSALTPARFRARFDHVWLTVKDDVDDP